MKRTVHTISALIVIAALLTAFPSQLAAESQQVEREARQTAKAKAVVARLGVGKKAATSVKLRAGAVVFRVSPAGGGGEEKRVLQTGMTLKGYISQAAEDSFTITDAKNNQSTKVTYQDVVAVRGEGLQTKKSWAVLESP